MHQPSSPSRIEQAVAFLEEQGSEETRLEDIARHVGMSPFHFARLFTLAMGVPPIAYQRRFRLHRAAAELASKPHKPLVEIALEAGFSSQQSFTRAYRRMFARTPGQQRRAKVIHIPSRQPVPSGVPVGKVVSPTPQLVDGDAMRLAGAVVQIDGISGKHPGDAWSQLDKVFPIGHCGPGRSFGVCWPALGASYDYMAAVELPAGTALPPGLVRRDVDAQRYAVFQMHFGVETFATELKQGLEEIWAVHLPASGYEPSGGPELELYADDFIAGVTEGAMAYWIPVL